MVVAAVAVLAGGEALTAARLGLSMTALQAAIGALNDIVDAPADARSKPAKPIPAGLVGPGAARLVVGAGIVAGLVLAWPSGFDLVGVAGLVLAVGVGYDLWAKGTAWSWLPFALGIPLLPVYGWLGATGGLAPWFVPLLPMAVLAGTGLAIANARADLERDRSAGTGSVAVALGDARSWLVGAAVLALALVVAVGWWWASGQGSVATGAAMVLGAMALAAGLVLGRSPSAARRERGWQLQAVGVGVVAVGWIAAVAVP